MVVTSKVRKMLSPMAFTSRRAATVAQVQTLDGDVWTFSKYDDGEGWLADAHFGPNGFPLFVHGEGERTTAKHVATDEVAALIESANFTE